MSIAWPTEWDPVWAVVLGLSLLALAGLVGRGIVLWYWRIDEGVWELRQIRCLLEEIHAATLRREREMDWDEDDPEDDWEEPDDLDDPEGSGGSAALGQNSVPGAGAGGTSGERRDRSSLR